ncbi:NAC domain containing protein 2 [Euphorbia peplus]|nr:NAC domain containing protein 2 [Euphorbia peplus]
MMMNSSGVNLLPPGFRFRPTDYEILMAYLLKKVKGLPLPCDYAITECDLYDGKDRWKEMLDKTTCDTSLYFFVKLSKKTEKGQRINRFAGTGTWKETQNEKLVLDSTQLNQIGTKKSFKFVFGKKRSFDNLSFRWLMDEYHLDSRFLDDTMTEYVVCHIKHEKQIKARSTVTWNVASPVFVKTPNVTSPISVLETSNIQSPISVQTSNVVSQVDASTLDVVSPVAAETSNVVSQIAVNASGSWTNEDLEAYYLWSMNQPMMTEEENGGTRPGWVSDSNAPFNSSSGIYLEDMEPSLAGNNDQATVEYNATDVYNPNLCISEEEFEDWFMLPAN